jgi:hypothetical protein
MRSKSLPNADLSIRHANWVSVYLMTRGPSLVGTAPPWPNYSFSHTVAARIVEMLADLMG